MKKALFILVLVMLVMAGRAEAASKATLSLYPTNVNVAPNARIQFSALVKKDGLVEDAKRVKITGPKMKKLTPTLIRMPEKPGSYKFRATAQGLTDTAIITVKNVAPAGKKRHVRPSIRIMKVSKKLTGKLTNNKHVTATVKVSGQKVRTVHLDGLDRKLKVTKYIDSADCKHGDTVTLQGYYFGIETKFLRFSLKDKGKRVIFKKVIRD